MSDVKRHLLEPLVPADKRDRSSCPGVEQPPVPAVVADLEAVARLFYDAGWIVAGSCCDEEWKKFQKAETRLREIIDSMRSQSATGGNDEAVRPLEEKP